MPGALRCDAMPTAAENVASLLHAKDGPLTRELLLAPGGFGLGQVPARLTPDATTTAGLRLLLDRLRRSTSICKNGEAINLTPAADYPVNLGMACPKGWEALDAARRARPRDDAAAARRARPARSRSIGTPRSTRSSIAFKAIQATHGPQSVAFLSTGQIAPRRWRSRRARQVRHGHGPRRRQHAAVHGHVGRRLQAGVRLRRAALHLRRLRRVRRASCWSARTCASRTRSCGSASAAIRTSPRSSSSIRGRPRRRWPRRSTCRCSPKSDLALFYGLAQLLIARRLDRPRRSSTRTPAASTSSRRHVAAFTPERVAAATGLAAGRASTRSPRRSTKASACRSGGRWASTRATRASAPRRRSSTWR